MRLAARGESVSGFLIYATPIGEHLFSCVFFTAEKGKIHCLLKTQPPEFARQFELKIKPSKTGYVASGFRYQQPLLISQPRESYFTLYINELIYQLLPVDIADLSLFGCYISTLMQLSLPHKTQAVMRFFEMRLLDCLGLGIDYQHDVEGQVLIETQPYSFQPGGGFVVDSRGRYLGHQIVAAGQLNHLVKGALSVARETLLNQLLFATEGQTIRTRYWPLPQQRQETPLTVTENSRDKR